MKTFSITVIIVVAVAVIAGFFVVGSPQKQRLKKFDQERVYNLMNIQSEIINYWINKGVLPNKLENLEDSLRGVIIKKDPVTGEAYNYLVKNKLEFELCAIFNLPSDNLDKSVMPNGARPYPEAILSSWDHKAGKVCFDRVIDPDLYKTSESPKGVPAPIIREPIIN